MNKIIHIASIVCLSIYSLNSFPQPLDNVKLPTLILDSHLNISNFLDSNVRHNNCARDNHFDFRDALVTVTSFEVLELEEKAGLSNGFVKIFLDCKITASSGPCKEGAPHSPNPPSVTQSPKTLQLNYAFDEKKGRFLYLGILKDISADDFYDLSGFDYAELFRPIKPVPYKGCGANAINSQRKNILNDSIVGIPN